MFIFPIFIFSMIIFPFLYIFHFHFFIFYIFIFYIFIFHVFIFPISYFHSDAFSVGSYICLVILAFIFSCLKGTTKQYTVLCIWIYSKNMNTPGTIKIYFKHSSHVLRRFIKRGKVCYWQGPEIPVFYGKFNLLLHSLDWKSELSKEKFNFVLFPDDKMWSEPVTSSHCGHPEWGGGDPEMREDKEISVYCFGAGGLTLNLLWSTTFGGNSNKILKN